MTEYSNYSDQNFAVTSVETSSVESSPNAPGIRPITGHSGAREQWRYRLVEQEMIADQLFLLLVGHAREWVIFALELAVQAVQRFHGDLLHLAAFCATTVRR